MDATEVDSQITYRITQLSSMALHFTEKELLPK
jgi:hypothetical protein